VITRGSQLSALRGALRRAPVVALLGARQVGKSTLARELARGWRGPTAFFDLENDRDRRRLEDPLLALEGLRGLVVLDEVQHHPELFKTLRVLADRRPTRARFLVLGSASPVLLQQSAESLAGRMLYHVLPGLLLAEVGTERLEKLWLRGGFPRAFTAGRDADSFEWRRAFVRTFLERDLPQLGVRVAPKALERFWMMLAHVHGGLLSWSELGRSLAVSDMTVRHYADLLAQTFMVRLLAPWHENISKRQVKSPKVYIRDSGLLHALLDVRDLRALRGHPKVGASFEGYCLEQCTRHLGADDSECFFWATHQGAELDLLVVRGGRRMGFEFKLNSAPGMTPSLRIALEDLKLDHIDVVHPGPQTFDIAPHVRALALVDLGRELGKSLARSR
jgi:predicted AAA+ superfamily ATPase